MLNQTGGAEVKLDLDIQRSCLGHDNYLVIYTNSTTSLGGSEPLGGGEKPTGEHTAHHPALCLLLVVLYYLFCLTFP